MRVIHALMLVMWLLPASQSEEEWERRSSPENFRTFELFSMEPNTLEQDMWRPHSAPLVCKNLENLRAIIKAGVRGGPYAMAAQYKEINSKLPPMFPDCTPLLLRYRAPMRTFETYPSVELLWSMFYEVTIIEMVLKDGSHVFTTIERIVGYGERV